MHLGGAQHKNHPFGRFFQGLQKGVKRLASDLMRFVNDEYFIAVAGGPVTNVIAQFAHFIDTAIGGGIDFNNIGRAPERCLNATGAAPTRIGRGPIHAIEAAGQNTRYGRLAGTTLPSEDITMRDPLLRDSVFERGANVLLPDQLRKRLRAVFPRDNLVHEGRGRRLCQTPGDPRHTS